MLTPQERERVRAAVDAAEKTVAAEIVPCAFAQSSAYPETVWAGAACGAALACGAFLVADLARPVWLPVSALMVAVCAAGIAGAALGRRCRPVMRFFLGRTAWTTPSSAARRRSSSTAASPTRRRATAC